MNGGIAKNARYVAIVAENGQAATAGCGPVTAADPIDLQVTFFGDVFDHVANLVCVGFDHDGGGSGAAFDCAPGVAVSIAFNRVGKLANISGPFALPAHFESGGAGGVEQVEEELVCVFIHAGKVAGDVGGEKRFIGEI